MDEDLKLVYEWIGLSASMIRSGEDFTPRDEQCKTHAVAALARHAARQRELVEALRKSRAFVLLLADYYSHGPAEVFVEEIDRALQAKEAGE